MRENCEAKQSVKPGAACGVEGAGNPSPSAESEIP